ncbi:MAG: hypothetical protein RLZZ195_992 [Pseudomonadota bacterium]|jgi:hypothetical protein
MPLLVSKLKSIYLRNLVNILIILAITFFSCFSSLAQVTPSLMKTTGDPMIGAVFATSSDGTV